MMTVPIEFQWVSDDFDDLNNLPIEKKKAFLKKEEIKIRQSLGEAVPTIIFRQCAKKIKKALKYSPISTATIKKIVSENNFEDTNKLIKYIKKNPDELSLATLSKIAEFSNAKRTDNAAFFTSKSLITEIMKTISDVDKKTIRILEPSAGVGNFIPLIVEKFDNHNLEIDLIDIDKKSLEVAKALLDMYNFKANVKINYIVDDFLLHRFNKKYDYIIGNPPFYKMGSKDKLLEKYRSSAINKTTTNICSFFLDKSLQIADRVALVFPKFLLNTPEFASSREYISKKSVKSIIDFGEKGFPGVLIETLAIYIDNLESPSTTCVTSYTKQKTIIQKQSYIFDPTLPYWIIYRDKNFDSTMDKLDLNVFDVYRDRQITNKHLSDSGELRILKARNVSDDGLNIVDICGYDSYISKSSAKDFSIFSFIDRDDVFLTPNMTYKPRVIRKPRGVLVNGSLAILIPKKGVAVSKWQMQYFSKDEYRAFYNVARNYQTRSLNVDACSVYFYGLLKERNNKVGE